MAEFTTGFAVIVVAVIVALLILQRFSDEGWGD
jgi:hypothetical protein